MKIPRITAAVTAIMALTLLVSCGSGGGLGGVFGGPADPNDYPGNYPANQTRDLLGTVNNVDTRAQRIDLTVNSNDGRSTQRTTSVYYDSRTRVSYQNQTGTPANLERGDQVDVRTYRNGDGQYLADTVTVTQSVSSNYPNGSYPNGNYPNGNYPADTYPDEGTRASDVRGTIAAVDTRAQRIDMNVNYVNGLRNTPSNSSVYYNGQTRVLYQNQSYRPADLERGDQIDAQVVNNNGQYVANTIIVTRSVRQ